MLCGNRTCRASSDDNIDVETNQLGRGLGRAFVASFHPAVFNRNGATFDPAKLAQSFRKGRGQMTTGRGRLSA
jgi:hypothetical protein